jgi:hypothetical protein
VIGLSTWIIETEARSSNTLMHKTEAKAVQHRLATPRLILGTRLAKECAEVVQHTVPGSGGQPQPSQISERQKLSQFCQWESREFDEQRFSNLQVQQIQTAKEHLYQRSAPVATAPSRIHGPMPSAMSIIRELLSHLTAQG